MAEQRIIAITGSTGFIGRNVALAAQARGWRVRALARTLRPEAPSDIDQRAWELGREAVAELEGVNHLVHAAAVPADRPEAHRLNVDGSRGLIEDARQAGVRKIVFLSSMSAVPGTPSPYGRDKLAVSAMLDPSTDLVIRPGLVLGSGGLFDRLAGFVRRRRVVPVVGGQQRFQTVLVDDLAEAICQAVERDLSGELTVAERVPVAFGSLLAGIAASEGLRRTFIPVPYWMIGLGLRLARKIGLRAPVSEVNLMGLRALTTQPVDADIARLGFEPRDYRASLSELAARR